MKDILKGNEMKTILIYSGGLDSTILLYTLLKRGHIIKCLSINYGQKHKRELDSAKYFCNKLNLEHETVDLTSITKLISSSSLTSELEVPEGYYTEENMKNTVVPNRNMIMLSIATGWAIKEKFNNVAYAAHSGDHTIYPDCREKFVSNLSKTTALADWHSVTIISPFVNLSKIDIVKLSKDFNIETEKTWSCYNGRNYHCGKCGACTERKEAFRVAGVNDCTVYE